MAPALPHDVWLNIADFLPSLALRALYPVNASLFHIALDARYRQLSFIYWDDRLLRNLIRLSDPYVARFVKILYIYPGFLKEVMDREAQNKGSEKDKEREKPSFHDRLADITHQLQDKVFAMSRCQPGRSGAGEPNLYDMHPKDSMRKLRERLKTAQDVMHAVLNLLRSLPSLSDYYITWYGLPTTSYALTNLAIPCLGAPLLSPSLSKLSLDISLENLDSLCSASFHVARLEHLHLNLHSDHTLSPNSLTFILKTRLARSISCLAPYLRLLSIEAREPVNIGPLFAGLDFLGKLDTVVLAMPLQKPHLGNPKALGRFLRSQAQTIKVLRLRVTQHDTASTGPGSHWRTIGTADPWSLDSWVQTAFGTETGGDFQEWFDEHDVAEPLGEYELDRLESLEVGSNLLPLETALYCAERFGSKVRSLSLLGGTKSSDFVKELVKVLRMGKKSSFVAEEDGGASTSETLNINTNLRTLRVGTVALSPELLDVLAHNLSNLRHLQLIVKHFLPSQDAVPIYSSSRTRGDGDGVQLEEQVYEFLETMQNDWSWPNWGLETISIYSDSVALSSPLSLPLPLPITAQPPTSSQETTPTIALPIPAWSSKVPSLASSVVTTVMGKKNAASTSTSSTLELPEMSASAPTTRYPTPSDRTPHPSSLLDLPCSYSVGALPLPISFDDDPATSNEEYRPSSSLTPRPILQLSSISTPSSPIGVSYEISPVSYIHLPSASTSALPASSSYSHMRDEEEEGGDALQRPVSSPGRSGTRCVFAKSSRSHSTSFATPSSPLASSANTNNTGSTTPTTSRGSHSPMFAFLRPGSRLRKEKGVREKRASNMDSPNTLLASAPISGDASGFGGERQRMEVGVSIGDRQKGSSSRREVKAVVAARNAPTTRADQFPSTGDVNFDPRMNDKGKKEKKKSSGLYALAVRVREHNRHLQKDHSRASSPSSSTSSFSPVANITLQKDVLSYGRQWGRERRGGVDGEKEVEWERERERRKEESRKPLTSFASLSSMSGLSEYSTATGGGGAGEAGRKSISDEGDASFMSSRKDEHNSGVGEVEERITLEVALNEILARCLPGVRVVR